MRQRRSRSINGRRVYLFPRCSPIVRPITDRSGRDLSMGGRDSGYKPSSLQSSNLNGRGGFPTIPSPAITLTWESAIPVERVDLELFPRRRVGFYLFAPLRRKRRAKAAGRNVRDHFRKAGYRHLKTYVCAFGLSRKVGIPDGVLAS